MWRAFLLDRNVPEIGEFITPLLLKSGLVLIVSPVFWSTMLYLHPLLLSLASLSLVIAQPAPSVQAGITAAIKAQAGHQLNGTAIDYTTYVIVYAGSV